AAHAAATTDVDGRQGQGRPAEDARDDQDGRPEAAEHPRRLLEELLQTRFERESGRGANDSRAEDAKTPPGRLDRCVSGVGQAGIEANRTHADRGVTPPRWSPAPRRGCRSWRRRAARRPAPRSPPRGGGPAGPPSPRAGWSSAARTSPPPTGWAPPAPRGRAARTRGPGAPWRPRRSDRRAGGRRRRLRG